MSAIKREYETILDRKQNPLEKSYTNYLFDKGLEKILKKMGEESVEVVIASMKNDKEETIAEICDVTYHILVLMAEMGITLEDIETELDNRAIKAGNFKGERREVTIK